uniref:Methyltransferase n=1 Tax=Setaria italica TaxID=4555 RepID=K3XF50_SETIT
MAISSALSFVSDRKRPIAVAVILFIVLSSLFLLFSPAPSALPFFSSPSSHLSSSETSIPISSNASPPEAPTSVASNGISSSTSSAPVPVSANASPPIAGTAIASDGVGSSTADPPRPDAIAAAGDAEPDVPEPDRGTPPAAAEASGSAGDNETTAGVSGERDGEGQGGGGGGGAVEEPVELLSWELCEVGKGVVAADYIPCLDNVKAIKALKSLRHMEHRERHCPEPRPRCLVPLPDRYRRPVPWPLSRDMIWYNNVPHPKLVEYKKDQNWVRKSGNYFVFPGGGTQFKNGVAAYIRFIEQILPNIQWGVHTRTVLDVGCGVASFGGYLLDRNVITMSLAPKDEHEAQIQFALERGIPAFLAVIGTQKLPFPDNSFDVIHCARCGKPLLELNRVLRPGGYYIWSATPVYRKDQRDVDDWNAMVSLTKSICWRTVVRSRDINKIGVVIYQKSISNSCYLKRKNNEPPMCSETDGSRSPWYTPLDSCLFPAVSSSGGENSWPISWPERLTMKHSTTSNNSSIQFSQERVDSDTDHWKDLVSEVYLNEFAVNWSSVRNVMDMNAGFGGFAASLIHQPLWVMNVVPVDQPDTLPIIFNRGLIGVYHDWCESFNTYPRTYDLLHMSYLLGPLTRRCHIIEVAAEIDRILRPGRWFVLQDTIEVIRKMEPVLRSLHYRTTIVKQQFLVAAKGFWRPGSTGSQS